MMRPECAAQPQTRDQGRVRHRPGAASSTRQTDEARSVESMQVSDGGGVQPRWSRNSREIYYRGGGHLVAATLDASRGDPVFGKPTTLFADDYDFGAGASIANYDVTPDGRFIMIRRGTNGGKLRVIINWTEELKQILAAGGIR